MLRPPAYALWLPSVKKGHRLEQCLSQAPVCLTVNVVCLHNKMKNAHVRVLRLTLRSQFSVSRLH